MKKKNKVIFLIVLLFGLVFSLNLTVWIMFPDTLGNIFVIKEVWQAYNMKPPLPVIIGTIVPIILCFAGSVRILSSNVKTYVNRPKKQYGVVGWGKISHITTFGLNFENGIVLGKLNNKLLRANKPLSTLLLAPPGTGKTAGVAVPTLLLLKNSVIVNDIKGELFELTGKVRGGFSEVMVFDPVSDDSAVFNVFASNVIPQNSNDVHIHVSRVVATLIKPSSKGDDEFFVNQAQGMFCFVAEWLIWKNKETSIAQIYKTIFAESHVAKVIKMMVEEENLPENLRISGNAVLANSESDKQWAGIVGYVEKCLRIFKDQKVEKATSGYSEIIASKFREQNTSLYITVRDKDQYRLKVLVSMLFDYLVKEFIAEIPKPEDQQITLIMDEFPKLGRLEVIKDLPAVSRGYKIATMFIAQDYKQIAEVYGEHSISIIDSATAYKIIMRQNAIDNAERIAKTIGNNTSNKKSISRKGGDMWGSNVNISKEGVQFLTPQDIMRIKPDECIILVEGNMDLPIKAKIPFWFNEPDLKKLVEQQHEETQCV